MTGGGWGTPTLDRLMVGETYVSGKDQATARALLDAAAALGLPSLVVRTAARGFIVPDAVYDRYANDQAEAHGI